MSPNSRCDRFCKQFGLTYPILQAPTGSIAGPELAWTVCRAGGMGAMALTWADPNTAAEQVSSVRRATKALFQVNYALAFLPKSLTAALEAGAPIVTFSWGDPTPYASLVRSFGARLGIQVTNAAGARCALEQNPDFLICQGIEAGGHVQATRPLNSILSDVLEVAGDVPVVAAGGIGDGKGIAAALQLGASAAMLGTRFVATQESRAHEDYKRRILESKAADTVLTVCFEGGWPYAAHRILRNQTIELWEASGCPPVGRRPGDGDIVGTNAVGEPILRYEDTAPRTGFRGDIGAMCLYAGTSCESINDLPSARDLVPRLWDEYKSATTVHNASE